MTDPRATLERALAPDVIAAITMLIDQRAEDIVEQRIARSETAASKPWLTTAEAAAMLGCTPVAVRARHKRGRLDGRYQGRRLYISVQSVIDLGAPSADARTALSNRVTPATRQRPGVRPRRKETHP